MHSNEQTGKSTEQIFDLDFSDFMAHGSLIDLEKAAGVTFDESEWFLVWMGCQQIVNHSNVDYWNTPLAIKKQKHIAAIVKSAETLIQLSKAIDPLLLSRMEAQLNSGINVNALSPSYRGERPRQLNHLEGLQDLLSVCNGLLALGSRKRGTRKSRNLVDAIASLRRVFDRAKGRLAPANGKQASFDAFLDAVIELMPTSGKLALHSGEAARKLIARKKTRPKGLRDK